MKQLQEYCVFVHPHEQNCMYEARDIAAWLRSHTSEIQMSDEWHSFKSAKLEFLNSLLREIEP